MFIVTSDNPVTSLRRSEVFLQTHKVNDRHIALTELTKHLRNSQTINIWSLWDRRGVPKVLLKNLNREKGEKETPDSRLPDL